MSKKHAQLLRIAIITMAYGRNYGNRLQNYALQEILATNGFVVETIRHKRNPRTSVVKETVYWIKFIVKRILCRNVAQSTRDAKFRSFNKRSIQFSHFTFGDNVAPDGLDSAYDFFVVGSDQVWNAHSNDIKSNLNNFLASFAPPEKRVAYAASFGTSDIAPGYEVFFRKELPKFKAIAVREKEGVRLVEQCGAKAVVTLDPTMMLTAERWNKLAKKPRFISSEPYVVTYFLGGRNEKLRKHIEKVANGAKIVHLDAEFAPQETIENPEAFATSPDEFLWLIAHAECVLTDSFHASVFSILYHKPFQVFERLMNGKSGGMESRIDTLLGTFHLEHCKGDISNPDGYPSSSSWADVDAILAVERKKSLDYLKNALRKE